MLAYQPVSSLMSTHLVTVAPEDNLVKVRGIFDSHSFHHLPVVKDKEIVGLISRTDFEHYYGAASSAVDDHLVNEMRLKRTLAEDIMTKRLGKVEPDDRINVALEIFCMNRFHALPVVEGKELVGIITPYDIMKAILDQKPNEAHLAYE